MADQNLTHAASLVPVAAHAGKPAMPLSRAVITIGNGKHNRVQLKSDSVSTTHAILVHTEAGWYVRDLGSRTHTILNGKVAREATLKNGDTLTIGSFVFEFKTDARGPETSPAPAALSTDGELPLPIDTKTTVIGRRTGCEIRLEEDAASNIHAILFEIDGDHYIRDLYSRTGTWLNGVKVHQERVRFGDEIRVGDSTFKYIPDESEVYAADDEAPAAQVAELPPLPIEDDATIPVAPSARDTIDADGPEHPEADADAPVLPLARRDLLNAGPLSSDSFVAVEPTPDAIELAPESASPEPAAAEAEVVDLTEPATESADDVEAELLSIAPAETTPLQDAIELAPEPAAAEAEAVELVEPVTAEAAEDVEAELLGLAPEAETTPVQDAIESAPAELAAADEDLAPLPVEVAEVSAEPIAEQAVTVEGDAESLSVEEAGSEVVAEPIAEVEAAEAVAPIEVAVDRRPPDVIATPVVAMEVPPAPPADSVPAAAQEPVERFADHAETPVVVDEEEDASLAVAAIDSPLEPTPLPEDVAELAKLEADVQAALDDPTRPLTPLIAPGTTTADAAARLGEAGRRTRLIAEMLSRHEDIEAEVERNPIEFVTPEPAGMAASADEDLLADTAAIEPPAIDPSLASPAPITDDVAPLEFADVPIEAVVPPLPELEPIAAEIDTEVEPLGFDSVVDDSLTERADTLTPLAETVTADGDTGLAIAPRAGLTEPHSAAEDDVVIEPPAVAEVAPTFESIDDALALAPTSLDTIAAAPQPEPLPTNDAADVPQVLAIDSDEKGVAVDDAQAPIEADAFGAGDVIATSPVVVTGPLPDELEQAAEAEKLAEAEKAASDEDATPAKKTRARRGTAKKVVPPKKAPAPKGRRSRNKPAVDEESTATDASIAPAIGTAAAGAAAAAISEVTPAANVAADVVADAARQDDEADVLGLDTAPAPAEPVSTEPIAEATPVDFAANALAAPETDVLTPEATPADTIDLSATEAEITPAVADDRETLPADVSAEDIEAEALGLAPRETSEETIDRAAVTDEEADVLGLTPTLEASTEAPTSAEPARTADGITLELAAAQAALGLAPESEQPADEAVPAAVDAFAGAGSAGVSVVEPAAATEAASTEIEIDQAALDADRVDLPAAADDEFRPMLATPLPLEIGEAPVEGLVALDAADTIETPGVTASLDLPTPLEQDARPLIAADEHLDDRELAAIDAGEMPTVSLATPPLPTINSDSLTGPATAPPVEDALSDSLPADAVAGAAIVVGDSAAPLTTDDFVAETSDRGVGFVNQFASTEATPAVESIEPARAELAQEAMASGDVSLDLIAADEVTQPNEDLTSIHATIDPVVAAEMVAEPEHLMSLTPSEPTPHEVVHLPSEAIGDDRTNAERLTEFAEPPPPTADSSMVVQSDAPTSVVNVDLPSSEEVQQVSQDAFADALAMAEGHSFAAPDAKPREPVAIDPNDPWVLDDSLLKQAEAAAASGTNGAIAETPANLEGFLNLGGVGYIGDPALDEYEPATPHKRVTRPTRTARQRRPTGPEQADDTLPPPPPVNPNITIEPEDQARLDAAEAERQAETPAARPTRPAAPPAVATTAPLAPAMPMSLPPRPRRAPPRGQATVDQSIAPAGAPSPFAGQALPLVDVFGGGTNVPAERLDEVLAKLGPTNPVAPTDGNPPPITTDKPAAGLSATPFASHVPIAQPGPPRRRPPAAPRRSFNNVNLLLLITAGLIALAATAAWKWPVSRLVVGEIAFKNLDRLNTTERDRTQKLLLEKVAAQRTAARNEVDDRYGDGFLDRPAEFDALVRNAEFRDVGEGLDKKTLLVLRRPSDATQAAGDVVRLNALLKMTLAANQDLSLAQSSAKDQLVIKQREIDSLRRQKDTINAEIDKVDALAANRPSESELRKVEQDVARLDQARQAAARTLAAREAEFKRLEAEATSLGAAIDEGIALAEQLNSAIDENAAVANVGRSIDGNLNLRPLLSLVTGRPSALASLGLTVVTPSTGVALFAVEEAPAASVPTLNPADDAELARLTKDRDAARARLEQLLASQAPEAKNARESFDQALEAFAGDVEKASKSLGDRPEVLAYVQSARALQDQIRRMTDTLVRRQQQQITRLGEFKRRLSELTDATREQRFGEDEQLKTWNNQLEIKQRQLNAAREAGSAQQEIDDTQREVSMLQSMVAARKELLNDPRASVVTKELEGMIATTQRDMLQDRADNEKLLADVQEAFRSKQPAVEKLPEDQKEIARQLAGRLAQIDLARQRYTNSLGIQAGGEALAIAQARQKLEELDAAVAVRKSAAIAGAQAQAAEMERRTRLAKERDEARVALVAARQAHEEAETAYAARVKTRDALAARLNATKQAGAQKDDLRIDNAKLDAKLSALIVQQKELEQQMNYAVIPAGVNAAQEIAPSWIDQRIVGGTIAVVAIVLCMSPFLWSAYRRQADMAEIQEAVAAIEPTMVEPVEIAGARPRREPFPPASPKFPSHVTPA